MFCGIFCQRVACIPQVKVVDFPPLFLGKTLFHQREGESVTCLPEKRCQIIFETLGSFFLVDLGPGEAVGGMRRDKHWVKLTCISDPKP